MTADRGQGTGGPELAQGVRALDHTADVGIEAVAPTLEALFHRAALGMMALIYGDDDRADRGAGGHEPPEGGVGGRGAPADHDAAARSAGARDIVLTAAEPAELLALWLRELLYLDQVDGFDYGGASFDALDGRTLRARIRPAGRRAEPIRELKGVTYHGLEAERRPDGRWRARVIFDV